MPHINVSRDIHIYIYIHSNVYTRASLVSLNMFCTFPDSVDEQQICMYIYISYICTHIRICRYIHACLFSLKVSSTISHDVAEKHICMYRVPGKTYARLRHMGAGHELVTCAGKQENRLGATPHRHPTTETRNAENRKGPTLCPVTFCKH